MRKQCSVVLGSVDAVAAVDIVSTITGDCSATADRVLYYPYFRFIGSYTLPTLFGRKEAELLCLVDAVTGRGATADGFVISQVNASEMDVINSNITADLAAREAQRTVTNALSKSLRVISNFDLALQHRGVVYKAFWIVSNGSVRAMVDQVNGSMHPLRPCAA